MTAILKACGAEDDRHATASDSTECSKLRWHNDTKAAVMMSCSYRAPSAPGATLLNTASRTSSCTSMA